MISTAWTLSRSRPTRPVARIDHAGCCIQDKERKIQGSCGGGCKKPMQKGQPVLVGTITIETSELLSSMLKKERHSA